MGILQIGIILAISSVAFCGTILPPFNYKIFEDNVVPLDIKTVNFLSIPNTIYEPIKDNFLMKEDLPPRTPAKEYGPPSDNDIFFKPPAPPSFPDSLPDVPLTTTTEMPITTRLEEEIHKPAEEYGPPQLDEMLFKPMETETPKALLPPGLPELPPSPKIPLTTTTTTEAPTPNLEEDLKMEEFKMEELKMEEFKMEEFPMEEIHKPAEEYGPPQYDEMMFKPIETTTPKILLPPGLPELPPAPVIPLKDMTTEAPRFEEDFPMEEMYKPVEEYGPPSLPEQPFTNPMMMLPELPPKMLDEMVEILKPMEEISVTTSDGHNFNIKISVTANTNFVQPQLPTPYFIPAIKAPQPISFPTGIPQLPPVSTFPEQTLNVETPMVEISSVLPDVPPVYILPDVPQLDENKEAPYPPAIPTTEIPFIDERTLETPSAPYPPAEPVTEFSTAAPTEAPPMVIFQKMEHYIPPTPTTNNAPYPPALPYSKYGHL
jgi:hypothetical protein